LPQKAITCTFGQHSGLCFAMSGAREMERLTKYLVGVVVVALLASIASRITAKKTEGLVATAVQVINTPLPVNSEGVKTPYAVTFQAGNSTVVPAGQRFVIESVSGWCYIEYNVNPVYLWPTVDASTGGNYFRTVVVPYYQGSYFLPDSAQTRYYWVFNGTNKIYADPGSTVYFNAFSAAAPDPEGCPVTLSGYLITP
jgi:hypothetical protein